MSIDFSMERWETIKENYGKWWKGELERPLVPIVLQGRDPGRSEPNVPLLTQATCTDLSISAGDLIDRIDYELSKNIYIGDAFPFFNMDCFGPGLVAAFLGAEVSNSTGQVWFHPKEVLPIKEIHFEYDKNNIWFKRIKEICNAAMKRWKGQVLLGMPDMGGIVDILSSFRPADALIYDLYDEPDEVKRLVWEIHELWHRFYNEINEQLQPVNPGYCDWGQIYSATPSYIIQSDFCYMVSPEMFDEFAKQELEATCKKLSRTVYHLDGVGNLAHLDKLLKIKELDVVQWIPGAGNSNQSNWPEVYRKIHDAGKKIQVTDGLECLYDVMKQVGTGRGINHITINGSVSQKEEMENHLFKLGIY